MPPLHHRGKGLPHLVLLEGKCDVQYDGSLGLEQLILSQVHRHHAGGREGVRVGVQGTNCCVRMFHISLTASLQLAMDRYHGDVMGSGSTSNITRKQACSYKTTTLKHMFSCISP